MCTPPSLLTAARDYACERVSLLQVIWHDSQEYHAGDCLLVLIVLTYEDDCCNEGVGVYTTSR